MYTKKESTLYTYITDHVQRVKKKMSGLYDFKRAIYLVILLKVRFLFFGHTCSIHVYMYIYITKGAISTSNPPRQLPS